jgi:hypothetical protein
MQLEIKILSSIMMQIIKQQIQVKMTLNWYIFIKENKVFETFKIAKYNIQSIQFSANKVQRNASNLLNTFPVCKSSHDGLMSAKGKKVKALSIVNGNGILIISACAEVAGCNQTRLCVYSVNAFLQDTAQLYCHDICDC